VMYGFVDELILQNTGESITPISTTHE